LENVSVYDARVGRREFEADLPAGIGESAETPMVSEMQDFVARAHVAGSKAFAEAGITHNDVDHLMIYDAFAHLPIYGLEDLGFVPRGEAGAFIAERNTAPGGKLPLNTNGGGLRTCTACRTCTLCRRACARCAALPRRTSPMPRSRSATESAAYSPPPAQSSCRTSRRERAVEFSRAPRAFSLGDYLSF
jgi:hypothetical protein